MNEAHMFAAARTLLALDLGTTVLLLQTGQVTAGGSSSLLRLGLAVLQSAHSFTPRFTFLQSAWGSHDHRNSRDKDQHNVVSKRADPHTQHARKQANAQGQAAGTVIGRVECTLVQVQSKMFSGTLSSVVHAAQLITFGTACRSAIVLDV